MPTSRLVSRRVFLQTAGVAASGFLLEACGGRGSPISLTASQPSSTAVATTSTGATTTLPGAGNATVADLVLTGGRVLTMDARRTVAQAVAVQGNRILAVGTDDEVRAHVGAATVLRDGAGKTVLPGLVDAHNHLQVWGNLLKAFIPLVPPEVRTLEAMLARLSEEIARTPAGDWIQGYFWNVDTPDRHVIDRIAPDNPIWLIQQGGHFGSCNTLALEIAGITSATPNPRGGVIERDANGVPTGRLYNHRAMDLLRRFAPQPTPEMIADSIHMAEDLFAAEGVTTFQDCNARWTALNAYLDAGRRQEMSLRAAVYYTVEWRADLERALSIEPYSDEYMRFMGCKFLIDGQFPTWFTRQPHEGISWDMTTWDPDVFKQAVATLHDAGLQVAVHCGGDASVDLALDAFEAAMNANPRPDPRHRIEHATLCAPDAVSRIADLGVSISTQPQFIRFAQDLPAKLGEERAGRIMVTRDWLDAGINVALGSDTPSTPWYKPQVTLVGAILRPGPDDVSFHPEQAMTNEEAVYAHTMGSAIAAHEEADRGSIEVGKLADLAVWNDDLTTAAPADIFAATVDTTYIGGKMAYQA